jgi:hypothetical protein
MSRLLHAAARGARIQTKWVDSGDSWQATGQLVWVEDMRYYRIHPADAHLQYGPVSTALREISQQDIHYLQDATGVYEQAAIEDYATHGELGYCWDNAANATAMHKSLFLLILAEFLADGGM